MKTKVATVAIVATSIVAGLSACGNSTNSTPPVDGVASSEPQSFTELFNDNYDTMKGACEGYNTLLNAGWDSERIYQELKFRGMFDGISDGKGMFKELVNWCVENGL